MNTQEIIDMYNRMMDTDSISERDDLKETISTTIINILSSRYKIIEDLCNRVNVRPSLLSLLPNTKNTFNYSIYKYDEKSIEIDYNENCGYYTTDSTTKIRRKYIDCTDGEFFEEVKQKLIYEYENSIESTRKSLERMEK